MFKYWYNAQYATKKQTLNFLPGINKFVLYYLVLHSTIFYLFFNSKIHKGLYSTSQTKKQGRDWLFSWVSSKETRKSMYTCAHNCRIQQLIPTHKPILKPSESNSQIRVLVTPLPPAGFGHNSPISSAVIFFVWCKILTFYNLTFTIAHKVQHYWTIKCNTYCILLMTIDTNTDVHRLTDMCTERQRDRQTCTHTHEDTDTHTWT